MNCREKLEAYLRANHVPFHVQHHPLAFTAQEVAASEHIPPRVLAKVVISIVDGLMMMLVLPASHRVDLTDLAVALKARDVRLAEESEFQTLFPDCEIGAMPPFGTFYDMPVYVDEALTSEKTIVFQAGTHTDTISLPYADFERLVEPQIEKFARIGRGEVAGMAGIRR